MERMKLPAISGGEAPSQTSSLLGNEQQGVKASREMNLSATRSENPSQTSSSSVLGGKQQIIKPPFGRNLPAISSGVPNQISSVLGGSQQVIRPLLKLRDRNEVHTTGVTIIEVKENKNTDGVELIDAEKNTIISPYQEKLYDIDQVNTTESPTIAVNQGIFAEVKQTKLTVTDIICIVMMACAFILWCFSLQHEDVHKMNDLGMISTFPPSFIISLIVLTVSFCLALGQARLRVPFLVLHLVFLIFMLYGIQNIVEEAARFDVVYTHSGYTEYIMRTGSVNPNLDTYFDWPGFFVLSALVTQLAGYHDIFSYAGWAPVFYNLIYALPLYMIFTVATTNKRLVWLGLWFFYLTNWIGQDYFSPQGLNFFFYLVIIAMLLKWFNVSLMEPLDRLYRWLWQLCRFSLLIQKVWTWAIAPDTHRIAVPPPKRNILLIVLLVIFAFDVFSHPLTPFFVIASVTALVIFRRCSPWWLPLLMILMTVLWVLIMAQPFLVGHLDMVIGSVGKVNSSVSTSVTSRAVRGDAEHAFIADVRILMSGLVWLLACGGALRRLRQGRRDITYILLAVVPFPIILVQQYGGEMFLRIYLFSLPFMVFFAAALFFPPYQLRVHIKLPWQTIALIGVNLVLLGGFLFTRYGNERVDYMTYDEVAGVRYLYAVAPANSLFVESWTGAPLQFKDFEKYTGISMSDAISNAADTVATANITPIIQFFGNQNHPEAYLLFTRSERANAVSYSGLPSDALDKLEAALLRSGKFKLIYHNQDAQILHFINAP